MQMKQQPTSSFATTQTEWGKPPEFLIPLNIIVIWGKPRAPPAWSLRLLSEVK